MPIVECCGENLAAPLSEVLRLFCGPVTYLSDTTLLAEQDHPRIICQVTNHRVRVYLAPESSGKPLSEPMIPAADVRREARRQLYRLLSSLSGIKFPWGSLTGIRPTLMALDALNELADADKAAEVMQSKWMVAPQQARLAVSVAEAEQRLMRQLEPERPLLYIGIPFCPSRCLYCSFITQEAERQQHLLEPFCEKLIQELQELLTLSVKTPSVIYIGGGTPSSLPEHLLALLLSELTRLIPADTLQEFTFEAGRPDTMTHEKLACIRNAGVTRICVNPQTFHDQTLERMGRKHTTTQTKKAFAAARQAGFDAINVDLIAGLPGEEPSDFISSVRQALELEPDSLTLHALALKRSSRLHRHLTEAQATASFLQQTRPDMAWQQVMAQARDLLQDDGFEPYYLYRQKNVRAGMENVGFARPGKGCFYNVGMMSDRFPVLGIGCGAASKRTDGHQTRRLVNPRHAGHYIEHFPDFISKKKSFWLDAL